MATNPFYIQPLGAQGPQIGNQLVGLGNMLRERKAEQAKAKQMAEAKAEVRAAYASGDTQKIANAMIQYPEMQKAIGGALGNLMKHKNEATKNNMLMTARQVMANPERTEEILKGRISFLQSQGADTSHTERELERYRGNPEGYQKNVEVYLAGEDPQGFKAYKESVGGGKGGLVSAKTMIMDDGTTVQVRPSGGTVVTDPAGNEVTGPQRLAVLREARQSGLAYEEQQSDIAVSRAQRVAAATGREKRISERRKELSDRNVGAARNSIRVNQALNAAANATQGIRGSVKMKMAKLFPSIDVTNEALLDQSLKGLAIDQLSQFKGPTTDFEFEQVERATGALGDPRSANIARIKALDRNNWFMRREAKQYKEYVKAGGDPDEFAFDFDEQVAVKDKVKGGEKTVSLRDLQETAAANNMTIEETIKALNK